MLGLIAEAGAPLMGGIGFLQRGTEIPFAVEEGQALR